MKKVSKVRRSTAGNVQVGKVYLFRSVTHYHVGRVKQIHPDCFVLSDAAWIPDTGRFSEAVKGNSFSEVEPFVNDLILFRGSLVDATLWGGTLPLGVK